jgi:hypothetical protein
MSLVEPPAGIEPATWWVEATRSVQLSYGGRCRIPTSGRNLRLIPISELPLPKPRRRCGTRGVCALPDPPRVRLASGYRGDFRVRHARAYAMLEALGGRSSAG